MSIAIKTCVSCGQVNPAIHGFCPICGATLADAPSRTAPWTFAGRFPPLAAAVDPARRFRKRHPVSDGRGAGLAWIGFMLAAISILPPTRSDFALAGWAIGVFAVVLGFWQMRRDPVTLSHAGIATNGLAMIVLSIVGLMIVSTNNEGGPDPIAAAVVKPAATTIPDWASPTPEATTDGSVLMFRGDAAHTGSLPGPGITGRPMRAWRFDSAGEIYSSPAVFDGLVYIGAKSGYIYALDASTGVERWRADLGDFIIRSSPAVVDGQVYIGAGYSLVSLDAKTGTITWKGKTPFSGSSSPSFADGYVYFASQSGSVYSYDASTGKQVWAFTTDGVIFSSPAISDDLIFIGTDIGKLLAISVATGQPRWRFETDGGIFSSPAVSDGIVYITTRNGKTYALDATTGRERWSYDAGGDASPAVADGVVYIASADGGVYALDAASGGEPKWLFPTGSEISASPVIADGVVYVASGTIVYAIDAGTGSERWRYAAGYRIETSPVVVNGYVYIGGRDGFLDAISGDGTI